MSVLRTGIAVARKDLISSYGIYCAYVTDWTQRVATLTFFPCMQGEAGQGHWFPSLRSAVVASQAVFPAPLKGLTFRGACRLTTMAELLVITTCKPRATVGWLMGRRWRGKVEGETGEGDRGSGSRWLQATLGLLWPWPGREGLFAELAGQEQLPEREGKSQHPSPASAEPSSS